MEEKKSGKKAAKRKRNKSPIKAASESDDSDSEIMDFGNGTEDNIHDDDDSLESDGGWSSDDDRELVQKVKSTSKENDRVNFKTRLKQMNWQTIAFKTYSPEDCEKRFNSHLKNVRRYRNLCEIATDIEANIQKCPLKKPLNSYQLFVQEKLANVKSSGDFSETMKNLAQKYKDLSDAEKASYKKKAELLRGEYKLAKSAFMTGTVPKTPKTSKTAAPSTKKYKTPFDLFAEQSEIEDKTQLQEEYAELSLDEKFNFIKKAISLSSEPLTTILKKDEIKILNGQVKPTPGAYNLFVKQMYNKLKEKYDKKEIFTELAQRWKSLDPHKKQVYVDAAALLKEKAFTEQTEFNERHGLTPQKPLKAQRRQSVFVARPALVESEQEEEEEQEPAITSPKPKKRKTSISSGAEGQSSDELNNKAAIKTTPVKFNAPNNETLNKSRPIEENRKKKLTSESETNNESDATSSSTSSKKKSKKEKKSKIIEPPTNKPPSDFFLYFAKQIHTGKQHKAKKAFDKLPKKERKQLQSEYNEKVEIYMEELKKYLDSISKEEALIYIEKVKAAEDAERKDDGFDGETSSQEY